jgi:uncharacterized protein
MDVRVVNNVEASRYEAYVGVELAGFSKYRIRPDVLVFTHTEVDDAFEGKGVASSMTRQVLDRIREDKGLKVTVLCPFVNAWLRRHPDYQDLTRR